MGNCTCSKMKEETGTEYSYNDDYLDIGLGDIIDEILSPPYRPEFADFIAELDDLDDDDDDYEDDDEDDDDDESIPGLHRDISFERDSNVSKPENVFIEDELCAICTYNFDEDQHVPRILPCGHTFCAYCIRKIARKYKFRYLRCPLDRKRHILKKQQHTDPILIGQMPTDTVSIASSISGSVASGSIDLSQFLHLNHRDNAVDEDDMIHHLGGGNIDTPSEGETEENFLDLRNLPSKYNTSDAESQVFEQLSTNSHETCSKYAVQYSNTLSGRYSDIGDESEIDNDLCEHLNHIPQTNEQRSLMLPYKRKSGRSWREEYDESDDIFNEYSDIIYWRRKLKSETFDNESKTDYDDVYADERSVRSFKWVEPDYD
ncbi:uncharacterized protein LOC132714149 isoform X2 [Ruditapes philippinarum]|nr:uncharacterized protein LOC132714149 isoform X2 [Ruditapes philippinarum]